MGLVVLIPVLIVLWLVFAKLRRPYWGLGQGLLGGILACGLTFGSGWLWLTRFHTPPRHGNDSDFDGLATALLFLIVLPEIAALLGFAFGLGVAFWREWRLGAELPPKPEPLDV